MIEKTNTKIMIVAGEASGDLHGANLVREIKYINPNTTFCGMGGSSLTEQGVEIMYDAAKLAVVGLVEVFGHLSDIKKARSLLIKRMQEGNIDLLILIDFPDFNLSLAKKAKSYGIPVFYYISPQVWAWRSGRVKKISALVDGMAVILPFEKDFYKQRGMDVNFVGHPLLDQVETTCTPLEFRESHNIPVNKTLIGILPGSRKKEVAAMLPKFLETAEIIAKDNKDVLFLLPLAPSIKIEDLNCKELSNKNIPIKIIHENRYDLMASCDLVMAASGTVTLELAILKTPMVVAYKISPLTYFLGRRLIKVKYASLVNLVADEEIVQEFIQDDFNADNLRDGLQNIWPGTEKNRQMKVKLHEVCNRIGPPGASRRTAELALQLV